MSFPQRNYPVKVRRINLVVAIIIIVIATTAGVVYALLNQSIPQTTIPASTISSSCQSLQTSSQVVATSGAIQYTCSGSAAFTSLAGTSTFTLTGFTSCPGTVTAPCYSNFGYVAHGDTTQCVAGATIGPAFHPIFGATNPLTFTAGSWDYCAFYAATSTGGSLPGFSIAWSP